MPVPSTLSASSIQGFEGCAARWIAEYYDRTPSPNNSAAALGTACHEALDYFVGTVDMHMLSDYYNRGPKGRAPYDDYMKLLFIDAYERLFSTAERFDEGWGLLTDWLARQTPDAWPAERTIVSREVKSNFLIKTSAGKIIFNYVWDRCDMITVLDEDGVETGEFDIEVVDYKTTALPLSAKDLKDKVQARMYAVSAMLEYPGARQVWVTFDQLRHDPVSVRFTVEQNRDAWKYLKRIAERIIATPDKLPAPYDPDLPRGERIYPNDDEAPETINPECRWCIRKSVCSTMMRHVENGGVLAISEAPEAAALVADIDDRIGALNTLRRELEPVILKHLEDEDIQVYVTDDYEASFSGRRQRSVDADRVRAILPAEVIKTYGGLGVTAIDKILKAGAVDEETATKLKALIRYETKDPSLKVKRTKEINKEVGV